MSYLGRAIQVAWLLAVAFSSETDGVPQVQRHDLQDLDCTGSARSILILVPLQAKRMIALINDH